MTIKQRVPFLSHILLEVYTLTFLVTFIEQCYNGFCELKITLEIDNNVRI